MERVAVRLSQSRWPRGLWDNSESAVLESSPTSTLRSEGTPRAAHTHRSAPVLRHNPLPCHP
eukprot:5563188-Prymnesium_polylepis.1